MGAPLWASLNCPFLCRCSPTWHRVTRLKSGYPNPKSRLFNQSNPNRTDPWDTNSLHETADAKLKDSGSGFTLCSPRHPAPYRGEANELQSWRAELFALVSGGIFCVPSLRPCSSGCSDAHRPTCDGAAAGAGLGAHRHPHGAAARRHHRPCGGARLRGALGGRFSLKQRNRRGHRGHHPPLSPFPLLALPAPSRAWPRRSAPKPPALAQTR